MAMLVAGYTVVVFFDALWTVPDIREHYSSGELMDAGWFFGYLHSWPSRRGSRYGPTRRPPCSPRGVDARRAWRTHFDAGAQRTLFLTGLIFPYVAGSTAVASR